MKPARKSSDLRKLAIAIATMIAVGGTASHVMALDVTATDFVTNLNGYVQSGDFSAAREALSRLNQMHVKQIKIGDQVYDVGELLSILSNPKQSPEFMAQLMAALKTSGVAYFVSENRVIASVNFSDKSADLFPTGSAG